MTKLCIPTERAGGWDDKVGEHFGRVPTYTMVDLASDTIQVIANTSEHAGGHGLPAEILSGHGVDVVICQAAGRRALSILAENGIEVCVGSTGTVRHAVDAWKKAQLHRATEADACQQHAYHDAHG